MPHFQLQQNGQSPFHERWFRRLRKEFQQSTFHVLRNKILDMKNRQCWRMVLQNAISASSKLQAKIRGAGWFEITQSKLSAQCLKANLFHPGETLNRLWKENRSVWSDKILVLRPLQEALYCGKQPSECDPFIARMIFPSALTAEVLVII